MTLTNAFAIHGGFLEDIGDDNSPAVKRLLRHTALCTDARVEFGGGKKRHIGDPTETAIVVAAHRNGMAKDDLERQFPRLAEIPFDSDRKLMTTVNRIDGKNIVVTKGAFDVLAERIDPEDAEVARKYVQDMSEQALRVWRWRTRRLTTSRPTPPPMTWSTTSTSWDWSA